MLEFAGAAAAGTKAQSAVDVDPIFERYDRSDSPGCSLGVVRAGEFVVKRSYGMANLEHGIPISADSVFRTGEVGGAGLAARRLETGRLSDGTEQTYAYGLRVSRLDGHARCRTAVHSSASVARC